MQALTIKNIDRAVHLAFLVLVAALAITQVS